jgi:hypothetical protein
MNPAHVLAVVTPYTVTPGLMDALQVTVLVLVAAGATAVVLTRVLARQVIALSVYGLLLAVLFATFQAPDVTLRCRWRVRSDRHRYTSGRRPTGHSRGPRWRSSQSSSPNWDAGARLISVPS